jgi:hypothetical protein
METLIAALGPAFAAGFAVQRLLELLDPILDRVVKENKKIVLGVISFIIGVLLAALVGLRVLGSLGILPSDLVTAVDVIVTGLIISAGTEGFNSILKFMGYAKDNKKKDAAS